MMNNHIFAFAISSQGCLVKFDAVLTLLIGFCLNLQPHICHLHCPVKTFENVEQFKTLRHLEKYSKSNQM